MKKIKCIEIDIIYNSAREAGKALNLSYKSISKNINGKLKSVGGFHFVTIDNSDISDNQKVAHDKKSHTEKSPSDISNSDISNSDKSDISDEKKSPSDKKSPTEKIATVEKSPIEKVAHDTSDKKSPSDISDKKSQDCDTATDSNTFNEETFYKNLFYQCISDFNKYRDAKIYPLIDKAKLLQEENTKLKEQRDKVIESVADDTTVSELKEIIESQNKEIEKLNNEYDLLMDSQGNGDFLKKKYRQQRDENKKMVQELISMKYVVEKAKDEVQEAIWGDFTQLEHEDLIKENTEMKKRLSKYEDTSEFKTLNYMNLPKEDNAIVAPSADTADTDTIDKALDDICNDKESDLIKDVKNIDSATLRRPNNEDNEIQEMAWSDI